MIKKIKILTILSLLFVLSCKDKENSHDEMLKKIDSIDLIEVKHELLVDSLGSVLDTISKISIKKDKNQQKVFEQTVLYRKDGNITTSNYFSNNILFYSKTETADDGLISIYQANLENERIIKAMSINYLNGKAVDTLNFKYDYSFGNNKKANKLVISVTNDSLNSSNVVIDYNELESPVLELKQINNELITRTEYSYNNTNLLTKKIIKDYQENIVLEFLYDDKGNISYEEISGKTSDSFEIFQKINFITDSSGEVIRKSVYNNFSGKTSIFEFR